MNNKNYNSSADNTPLPHDEDFEKALLGAVIIEGGIIEKLIEILEIEDFYTTKHQIIYSAMKEIYKNKRGIDILTLGKYLISEGHSDEIGGGYYLTILEESNPTTVNWKYYADEVKELSRKRKLVNQIRKLSSSIINNKIDSESAISQLQNLNDIRSKSSKLVPVRASDLPEYDDPIVSLWGDIIYPACIAQINSEPGVGKTTFAYNLSINGTLGKSFLGIPFSKNLKVCYIDLETPNWKRTKKVELISNKKLSEEPLFHNLHFLDFLDLPNDFPDLLKLCSTEKYDLVIFDTQSKILNLEKENDNSEANRMMKLIERIPKETECSVVLIHHTGKSEKKGAYSGRGASAIGAAVDIVVNMEMLDEDTIKLKVDKNRVMGDYPTLYLKKIGEDNFEPFTPEGESSGFDKFKAQDFILSLGDEKSSWATGNIIERGITEGFAERTIKRAISNLSETGKIKKVKHGLYDIPSKCQSAKMPSTRSDNYDTLALPKKNTLKMPDIPIFD